MQTWRISMHHDDKLYTTLKHNAGLKGLAPLAPLYHVPTWTKSFLWALTPSGLCCSCPFRLCCLGTSDFLLISCLYMRLPENTERTVGAVLLYYCFIVPSIHISLSSLIFLVVYETTTVLNTRSLTLIHEWKKGMAGRWQHHLSL